MRETCKGMTVHKTDRVNSAPVAPAAVWFRARFDLNFVTAVLLSFLLRVPSFARPVPFLPLSLAFFHVASVSLSRHFDEALMSVSVSRARTRGSDYIIILSREIPRNVLPF